MNHNTGSQAQSFSRRSFLAGVGTAGAVAGLAAVSPAHAVNSIESAGSQETVIDELPIPSAVAPEQTEYEVDVLVVGSGYAGIPAAYEAKKAGANVLLVDKGYPAHTGCSPYAQCYQFFDEQYGDDPELQRQFTMQAGDYLANLDWYDVYMKESRAAYDQCVEWGIFTQYPNASESDYYDNQDEWGYFQENLDNERRGKWVKVLEDNDIPFLPHIMITDVIEQDGKAVGAMGLHVPSATVVTFHAKSVILCVGIGAYRNTGFPLGPNTFDGEWMAYQLGLPVTGKEWDHLEATNSVTPASCWRNYSWGYIERLHATAGMSVSDTPYEDAVLGKLTSIVSRINAVENGIAPIDFETVSKQGLSNSVLGPEDDPRTGNDVDDMPKRDIYGGSVGMGIFKSCGIFCGLDDLVGFTGLPGLYVAGDANGAMVYGAVYTPGQGGSVGISHIQGRRAAQAAVEYCSSIELERITDENIAAKSEELLAPLNRETGYDPHWARDVLASIMSPYWVQIVKTETSLNAALTQVEQLRDEVLPKLIARNPHDLRLVHECLHRTLSAEMKLRASLERKESRGSTYRADYPYRDDENFLCYITLSKGEDGTMQVNRVPIKDEWKGDTTLEYAQRYISRYPGEAEALGLSVGEAEA